MVRHELAYKYAQALVIYSNFERSRARANIPGFVSGSCRRSVGTEPKRPATGPETFLQVSEATPERASDALQEIATDCATE